jgi:hypothetical protein
MVLVVLIFANISWILRYGVGLAHDSAHNNTTRGHSPNETSSSGQQSNSIVLFFLVIFHGSQDFLVDCHIMHVFSARVFCCMISSSVLPARIWSIYRGALITR